jgi:hypothetical protein
MSCKLDIDEIVSLGFRERFAKKGGRCQAKLKLDSTKLSQLLRSALL